MPSTETDDPWRYNASLYRRCGGRERACDIAQEARDAEAHVGRLEMRQQDCGAHWTIAPVTMTHQLGSFSSLWYPPLFFRRITLL